MKKKPFIDDILNIFSLAIPEHIKKELCCQSNYVHINGTVSSSARWLGASIIKHLSSDGFHLWITDSLPNAAYTENELSQLLPDYRIFVFPHQSKTGEDEQATIKTIQEEALYDLHQGKGTNRIWVLPIHALLDKVISKEVKQSSYVSVHINEVLEMSACQQLLNELHFELVDFVSRPGHYAIRGGIIDIFSFHSPVPYRIELEGDMVKSIRQFDSETQRSTHKVTYVDVLPPTSKENIQQVFLYEELPPNTTIWIDNWEECKMQYIKEKTVTNLQREAITLWEEYIQKKPTIEFSPRHSFQERRVLNWHTKHRAQPLFNQQYDLLIKELHQLQQSQFTNCLSFSDSNQYERLDSILEDLDETISLHPIPFSLQEGFITPEASLAIFTDHQLFGRYHRHRLKRNPKSKDVLNISTLKELQPGDFVTHIDHGVGTFSGLQKIDVQGKQQEAIRILYKDGDILYVHIHALHKIAKYLGKEGRQPTIHKLGSNTWSKVKQKTRKRVKEIAFDLITLYAKRKEKKGFAHTPDNYLQREMEASFIYEETADQQKAIQDVKQDMESEAPMDRLVCGDVGFGKTEVAIRAACKSILDGKQVAVLVPTTVLAFQHYRSFKQRMKVLDPRIVFLSRFKTKKEKLVINKKLLQGEIDIVIGTHALLSKDIVYKDLGLLIIDEEQKFGVAHKEKLKTLKENIDCLILTATPIPRTLQLGLMGARDLSMIQTPPANRQSTHTEIASLNLEELKRIIYHEIERSGQIFVIHNRIKDILELTDMIKTSCPKARVNFAHGQLEGHLLEKRMVDFIHREYDVLVSTSIIESGLDIPNANTMIIHNAHQFGLSDLHQLRGRVGRSNKKSYCYLISPPFSTISNEAKQRLKTIEMHSELGSGFQIAMRDLDIRGAGNILGAEQSGFIDQMGFETYQKIISEAVAELKQEEFSDLFSKEEEQQNTIPNQCHIETDFEVYIPDQYMTSSQQRIAIYQKINATKKEQDLDKIRDELKDRFGTIPNLVEDIFMLTKCRFIAEKLGFERLVQKREILHCHLAKQKNTYEELVDIIMQHIKKKTRHMEIKPQGENTILLINNSLSPADMLQALQQLQQYQRSLDKEALT